MHRKSHNTKVFTVGNMSLMYVHRDGQRYFWIAHHYGVVLQTDKRTFVTALREAKKAAA